MVHHYIGIDLGGTHLRAAIVDITTGAINAHHKIPAEAHEGHNAVIDKMALLIEQIISEANFAREKIGGIGIGVPGSADLTTGTVIFLPNLPGQWKGVPLAETLTNRVHLPIQLLNDVRAMTLAEWKFGAGRGVDCMVCYAIGTGIGGGLVVNGKLHLGIGGTAGEFGHQVVEVNGPFCGCGSRGCLEMFASGPAIASAGMKAVSHGHTTLISTLVDHNLNLISSQTVSQAALAGDKIALEIFQQAGKYLGIAVGNMLVALSPNKVVFGGGVAEAGELLMDPIRKTIKERVFMVPVDQIEIVRASLGTQAGLIGAAYWSHLRRDA